MPLSKITQHIDELYTNTEAYVESTLEYYKLFAFKKLTESSSMLVNMLVAGSIFLIFIGFLSFGGAFLIGTALDSYAAGFFIVAGFYLLLFIIFLLFGKNMFNSIILSKFSKMFFNESTIDNVLDEPLKTEVDNQ
ncbi:phage holin family protein [Mesonia aestuariivivens]|uniref:Phage holin family protein n=1 Tax=Mesonia aestuariivivens TaxID=2796128 RepID=A0ABS6W1Z5_9FLAO|nr:phage holin family protein [Mesonia aestuariivivens]MBW2961556.1 phage holin family protein [Mesonia aestuariivivens]